MGNGHRVQVQGVVVVVGYTVVAGEKEMM